MRVIIFSSFCIALCAANANLLVPGDNTGYVEGESRYIWMPDGEGVPHLVDLQQPADVEFLNARNGMENAYWLFTRENPNDMQLLKLGSADSIFNSNYKGVRPTTVIVHGWKENGNSPTIKKIRNAFLAVMDCNVIVVDWHRLASKDYNTASKGVPEVAFNLDGFINFLFYVKGGKFEDLHLVGFSLGAHVVGSAGRNLGGYRVQRITGLDPAGPTWKRNPNALNRYSAKYVESIHTDGQRLGIMDPISHADFYPNGGKNPQPGCVDSICSHQRALEFFVATIYHNHLYGKECANIAEAQLSNCNGRNHTMGNTNVKKYGEGIYGLRTGA